MAATALAMVWSSLELAAMAAISLTSERRSEERRRGACFSSDDGEATLTSSAGFGGRGHSKLICLGSMIVPSGASNTNGCGAWFSGQATDAQSLVEVRRLPMGARTWAWDAERQGESTA